MLFAYDFSSIFNGESKFNLIQYIEIMLLSNCYNSATHKQKWLNI